MAHSRGASKYSEERGEEKVKEGEGTGGNKRSLYVKVEIFEKWKIIDLFYLFHQVLNFFFFSSFFSLLFSFFPLLTRYPVCL